MSEESITYSSSPFISHDGEDENGVRAEVKVVKGFGHVKEIEPSDKGVAAKVVFKVANTKYPSSGYIPMSEKAFKMVEKAHEDGNPIHFRIETVRKNHVDRSLPMEEISPPRNADMARENTFKSLAGVRFDEDDEMTLSTKALTNPDEDPSTDNGRYSAVGKTYDKPSKTSDNSRGNIGPEPGYFTKYLSDGTVNPASGEITAIISIYGFVSRYSKERSDFLSLDEAQRAYVSRALYKVAERMQSRIWEGHEEAPEGMSPSHMSGVRSRQIMFEMIESFYPLDISLFTEKEGKRYPKVDEWAKDIEEKGLSMWKWAQKVVK